MKKDGAEVIVDKVLKDSYRVEASFWLSDCFKHGPARDFVNRRALEFRKKSVF